MRKLWRKRWFRVAAYCLGGFLVLMGATCWFFRISSLDDIEWYQRFMSDGYHPIWRDLALRRIGEGDSVEELRKIAQPTKEWSVDGYTSFYYFLPGGMKCPRRIVHLLAKDGRLFYAEAGSCFWGFKFFGDMERVLESSRLIAEQAKKRADHNRPNEQSGDVHDH